MPEVSKSYYTAKDVDVKITQINDAIYRISGFVDTFGITFNQFLTNPYSYRPHWDVQKIEERVKEVIPLQKLAYLAFLHFESDEWGGMAFLDSAGAKLVCSDLTSKLNMTGWYDVPVDHISFWDNEILKTGKRRFKFIMTPYVHHWDSMMVFEETTKSLFPSDLFIQPGDNKPITSDDLSKDMIALYKAAGIFGSEEPLRQTTRRLINLSPKMIFPSMVH